ncbi:MAG: carboxypeptidase regulatory-like domain-containing protein [Planctomycetaceae bacterium]|nr:carboxypeptidase regulatory-like domain-containing protein [Planctomycetaceae bacterium]
MRYGVCVLLAMFLAGCGEDDPPAEKPDQLLPVTGTVKMDGKPLPGAVVIFLLQGQGTSAFNVMGSTGAEGTYTLKTRAGQEFHDGAPPGEYKVFITRMVKPDGSALPPDPSTPPAMVGAKESIAFKFSNPGQTVLKASVAPGKDKFDFEVEPNAITGGPPRL